MKKNEAIRREQVVSYFIDFGLDATVRKFGITKALVLSYLD